MLVVRHALTCEAMLVHWNPSQSSTWSYSTWLQTYHHVVASESEAEGCTNTTLLSPFELKKNGTGLGCNFRFQLVLFHFDINKFLE